MGPSSMAFIGVWECILLSSISLQLALCLSAWQFYRVFREAGIYPPNVANVRVHKEVSPLEFLCEAEDVALLSDQCSACSAAPTQRSRDQCDDRSDFLRPPDTIPYSEFEEMGRIDIDLPPIQHALQAAKYDMNVNRM